MDATWRTVRVFISSTFCDTDAERDHLVAVVFPELRERTERLGLEFFDVGLRWGVPAEDLNGETANSWEYRRQWIDRVEPFFVFILGQRYGWVREPQQFRGDVDGQRQEQEARSITDLEVRHAVLDNRRSYFSLRATSVPEPNAECLDPSEYQARLEQLKTAVRQRGRPVRNYSPRWTGQGFVGLWEFGDPCKKIVALTQPSARDPLDVERLQMKALSVPRPPWFQGRTMERGQLLRFRPATNAKRSTTAITLQHTSPYATRCFHQLFVAR